MAARACAIDRTCGHLSGIGFRDHAHASRRVALQHSFGYRAPRLFALESGQRMSCPPRVPSYFDACAQELGRCVSCGPTLAALSEFVLRRLTSGPPHQLCRSARRNGRRCSACVGVGNVTADGVCIMMGRVHVVIPPWFVVSAQVLVVWMTTLRIIPSHFLLVLLVASGH